MYDSHTQTAVNSSDTISGCICPAFDYRQVQKVHLPHSFRKTILFVQQMEMSPQQKSVDAGTSK
jgi:hypothetical protein